MNESRDRKLILCANQNGDHYVERKWDIVELIQQHEGNESWLTLYKDRSTYY